MPTQNRAKNIKNHNNFETFVNMVTNAPAHLKL